MAIQARIIRIGNSRGVRLPKHLLEQTGLGDMVVLEGRPGEIVIRAAEHPRAGWAEAFAEMAANGDDRLLDEDLLLTEVEETEWRW